MNAISPQGLSLPQPTTGIRLQMLADIAEAAHTSLPRRHKAVAAALAPYLGLPGLLDGLSCPSCAEHYSRHLLHNNAAANYAVVAIVWAPGQMSPVHAHRTWCAFGIHQGWLAETYFDAGAQAAGCVTPSPTACHAHAAGSTGCAPAGHEAIHRLANLGTANAISLHVYGVAFDDFGVGVNEVYAP